MKVYMRIFLKSEMPNGKIKKKLLTFQLYSCFFLYSYQRCQVVYIYSNASLPFYLYNQNPFFNPILKDIKPIIFTSSIVSESVGRLSDFGLRERGPHWYNATNCGAASVDSVRIFSISNLYTVCIQKRNITIKSVKLFK